jgi:two-component system, OmpR family, alkaline phosphatase synthesis response regulator PhoP
MDLLNPLRILVVDDDKDILDLLKYNFEKAGFEVRTIFNSTRCLSVARKFKPDLIVLDVMMPETDGIELCRKLRSDKDFSNTYIFFLSARSEAHYHNAALELGADDFIEKLNGIRSLTNKVTAVLKNNFTIRKSIVVLRTEDIVIHKPLQLVYLNDHPIAVSQPEFDILFFMIQNANKNISIDNLVRIIWGSEVYIEPSAVEAYVENLQNKIGRKRIQALGKSYYRLNQTVL